MNIKLIVNFILVVIILHLLLDNIPRLLENFDVARREDCTTEEIESAPTTTTKFDNPEYSEVKPGNYYEPNSRVLDQSRKHMDEQANAVNFTSNVTDLDQYFAISNFDQHPDLNKSLFKGETQKQIDDHNMIDHVMNQPAFTDNTNDLKKFSPENWNYKKETVSNGGELMAGVVGFDSIEDQYASYTTGAIDEQRQQYENDDLRMGMGLHQDAAKAMRLGGGV